MDAQIAARQIFATLSPSPTSPSALAATTVSFTDDPEPFLSAETAQRVTRAIEGAQALERQWAAEADRIEESREFATKVRVRGSLSRSLCHALSICTRG